MVFRCAMPVTLTALLLVAALPGGAGAQDARFDVRGEVFVNSETEEYLRLLQIQGKSPRYPWSIRSFSPREVEHLLPADSLHPWARRYDLERPETGERRAVRWVAPRAQLFYNSAFPYGHNDGPVWQGKGVTTAVEGGVSLRQGPFSLTLAPMVFVAQNSAFRLRPNGLPGQRAFADGEYWSVIDLPQRFGDGAYVRVDPGQSTLRADFGIVALGLSTANQHWGPAAENPLLLGNNAAGYPHAFAGTSRPVNVGIGRLHGRLVWGVLGQSAHSPVDGELSRRFMSGAVATFTPRGVDGLEVGGGRFFHAVWPDFDGGDFLKPVQGIFKLGVGQTGPEGDRSDADNQLASLFFRWVLPGSAAEVYGEYAREDHSADLRDFVQEPDHNSGYVLGLRKVLGSADDRWTVVRGEFMNTQRSHLELGRYQGPFYQHIGARQGHTQQGQILGSAAGLGGQAGVVGLDRYHPRGRWSAEYRRALRGETTGVVGHELDVTHGLGLDMLLFRRGLDVRLGVTGVYEQNRDFRADAFNANVVVGATLRL